MPAAAKSELENQLHSSGLINVKRNMLLRLADPDNQNLRSGVWEKLPDTATGREHEVIRLTIIAYDVAQSIRPPWPKKKSDSAAYLEANPLSFSPHEMAATLTRVLISQMQRGQSDARFCWPELWPSDPAFDFDAALRTLESLADFYERLARTHAELVASMEFRPPPHKRGAKNARNTHFTGVLSDLFQKAFGEPLDAVVTALAEACFDVPGTLSPDTVRKRRQRR
jgi:hypothetical protein